MWIQAPWKQVARGKSTAHLSVRGLGLPGPGTAAATTQAHMASGRRGGALHPGQARLGPEFAYWGLLTGMEGHIYLKHGLLVGKVCGQTPPEEGVVPPPPRLGPQGSLWRHDSSWPGQHAGMCRQGRSHGTHVLVFWLMCLRNGYLHSVVTALDSWHVSRQPKPTFYGC